VSAALSLLLQAIAPPPLDWSALPELPLSPPRGAFDPSGFVRNEVAARRCRATADGDAQLVTAPLAVLVDESGAVSRIVPRAIDCPTVEQYTAGYVSALARRAGLPRLKAGWYRYAVTYRWGG
jgi:hypothetical protein